MYRAWWSYKAGHARHADNVAFVRLDHIRQKFFQ